MVFFAIAGKAEATRGDGCWSWTKKSASARVALTGIRQTGKVALFAATAGLAYDPKSWALELDNKKSESACSALKGIRQTSRVAFFATPLG